MRLRAYIADRARAQCVGWGREGVGCTLEQEKSTLPCPERLLRGLVPSGVPFARVIAVCCKSYNNLQQLL